MKLLDRIPLLMLALVAVFLGIAPFPLNPEPHLLEKLRMLGQGALTRPVDVFDLLWHALAPVLLVLKLIRMATLRKAG